MIGAPLRILIRHNQAYESREAVGQVDHQGNAVEVCVPNKQRIDGQHDDYANK